MLSTRCIILILVSMFYILMVVLYIARVLTINQSDVTIRKVKYFWNIPTFQCDSHKINFTGLAEKYNIVQNKNDRFRGDQIVILYDPGQFPAILEDDNKHINLRNGGVPQQGNLTLHLELFQKNVEELIAQDFAGIGIIDFESWRPIFRQNFGSLIKYKELSKDLVRQEHPFWPSTLIEKEATNKFEFYGRQFMEETLYLAKQLRSNATWGYYAYPYCFNMSPKNMQTSCPSPVPKENIKIEWLFNNTDNLYPSIYLNAKRLKAKQRLQMVEGRIMEAQRIANLVKTKRHQSKILPYFWYKYQDTNDFVSKEDLINIFQYLSKANIDGLVLWGSSNDVNTKKKCFELYEYVDRILGPYLQSYFN